jgi:hypothetical protein
MKIDLTKLGIYLTDLIDEAKESEKNGDHQETYSLYLGEIEIEGITYQIQIKLQSDEFDFLEALLDSVIE